VPSLPARNLAKPAASSHIALATCINPKPSKHAKR
jgi:hypothetical protein